MQTTDIRLHWDTSRGDWRVSGMSLETGHGIETAVLISLFTDRVAGPDDIPPDGTGDPRGWWADGSTPVGSRLWLIERSKHTDETLRMAQGYIAEALQWLIDDGAVEKFDIRAEWINAKTLGAQITAHKPDGTTQALRYAWAWNGVN